MGNDLGGTNSEVEGINASNPSNPFSDYFNDNLKSGLNEGFNSDNVRSNDLFDTKIGLGGGNEGVSAMKSGVKAADVEVEAANGMCWDNDSFHAMKDSGNPAGVNDQYKATNRVSFASNAQGKDIKVKKSKNRQETEETSDQVQEKDLKPFSKAGKESRNIQLKPKKVNEDPIEVKGSIMTSFQSSRAHLDVLKVQGPKMSKLESWFIKRKKEIASTRARIDNF
ncbi:hypothetical protein Tco_0986663 [Tanacetum coccineum]